MAVLKGKSFLKQGLLLKERICSQKEQILLFKSSLCFGNNTKENFLRFFLGVHKHESFLAMPLRNQKPSLSVDRIK